MYIKLNGIWLSSDKPETFTQAYHAGAIVAMVENFLPKESVPSIPECMVNFHALRELFGERLWQKLKLRSRFRPRIHVYELLAYQPFLPRTMIGTSRDFCLGYVNHYKLSKVKKRTDNDRLKEIQTIIDYLSK
jgi:hypothetical protein